MTTTRAMTKPTAPTTRTACGLAVVAFLAVAGCSSGHHPTSGSTQPSSAISTSSAVATTSALPSAAPKAAASAAFPASFAPESVTFVSSQTGFVLGQVPCPTNLCYGLATTTDGGRTWRFVANLPMPPQQDQPVTKVRFADPRDGWVFGPQLWATHDGGVSWHQLTTPAQVSDVEASAGLVYALSTSCSLSCSAPAKLLRAPVTSDAFVAVAGATLTTTSGWIALHGKSVWVLGGTVGPGVTYIWSQDGSSWASPADPCPTGSEPSYLVEVAPVTTTTVYLLCSADPGAGSETKIVMLSTDGGVTAHVTPGAPAQGGLADDLAAASSSVVAVSAHSGASWIYRSADAGHTWGSAVEKDDGGMGFYDLGFTTTTQGVVVHGTPGNGNPSQLLMTRDAGATWTPVTF